MKKILISILISIILISMFSVVNASSSQVVLSANVDKVQAGDTFTVDITVNADYDVTGMSSLLTYDKTKLSLEKKETAKGFLDVPSGDELNVALFSLDGVTLSKSVKIYTLTFKVLDNVSEGDIEILLSDIELALVNNKEQIDEKASNVSTKITVVKANEGQENPGQENQKPDDNTTAGKDEGTKLPQTGIEIVSVIVMAVLAVVSVIFYKSYIKYRDI